MIKIRHRRNVDGVVDWHDAYLLSFQRSSSGDQVAIVAYEDHAWGHEQGLKVAVEHNLHDVRIARTRIPLFDPPTEKT